MAASHPDIAFDTLLTILKKGGFSLSPGDYIEFAAVFNQFTGSREDLKYYLAPILCRNREEQQRFYAIYDRYTTPPGKRRPAPEPAVHPFLTQRSINWHMRRATRLYYTCVILASVIIGSARIIKNLHHKHIPVAVTAPVPDTAVAGNTDSGSVTPVQKLVVRSAAHTRDQNPEEKSILVPAGPEIEKENHVHSTAFAWMVIFGTASFFLSVSFFPLKRSRSKPHVDIDEPSGDAGPLDIPFQPKEQLIHVLPHLAKIARDLAQPIPTDQVCLRVNATIHESINAGGLLIPVYSNLDRRPEWLVLIDRRRPLNASLYSYLCRTLAGYGLPINYYYQDGNDVYFAESSAFAISSYQLQQRHGDAQVIDFDALDMPGSLLDAFPFGPPIRNSDMEPIRNYLDDEDLFQWLCAIAVYPTVRWETVLAIGAAILKARGVPHKLNFISLLRLSRIEWLSTSTGAISDDIRFRLLKSLGVPEELAAREAILDLLRESDDILVEGTAAFEKKMQRVHTQSFILFAHDTRRNASLGPDARKFITAWNRRNAIDLATVLYLSNPEHQWDTPIRSAEDRDHAANADRFINELLAHKVIANPRTRAIFRNLAVTFFFLLLLLFLFKDNIQPTALNAGLGLVDRNYPDAGTINLNIPVTKCLKKMTKGHYLLVTLRNYDNNLYTQLLDMDGKDTLKAAFSGITMAGKDTSQPAFQVILNKTLTIDVPNTRYYEAYNAVLRGDDCDIRLPKVTPVYDHPSNPNAMQQ